ncbi:rfbD [Candidatus Regiella insecticola 5.15]|uniref:dTDP-4-dehydrorhamnose reductase n=1 Tax=Candidatus Regiella insecticola 5.15 TaxID=1005043 RepID=G2GWW2_9ENTR|nr:dTDP-4-dehydrorhamnose reductase [Candidatus Regiella insecticola]EGY29746.1 rfbD [Candidatus Regiella insecticola 5.15]
MKILLLGKQGQVGRELQRTLLPLGEVMALGRQDIDLENLEGLENVLRARTPDIIVNAAAYTAVDQAETHPIIAHKINAKAVEVMTNYARQNASLLVHYSTDYVFDGKKATAYVEIDATHPQSVYGHSKEAGEKTILQSGCQALIFRTSWVFSAQGNNFVKTILRLAKERDNINVVADQYGAPTSAELIADVTLLAIAYYRHGKLPMGLYHLTATGKASWHDFACHIVNRARVNGTTLKLSAEQITPISTEAYPLPAKRPNNSLMNTGLLSRSLGLTLPDWKIHADRTIDQLTLLDIVV